MFLIIKVNFEYLQLYFTIQKNSGYIQIKTLLIKENDKFPSTGNNIYNN